MKTNDVFADEVPVDRPARCESLVVVAVAVCSDVVGECVEPHVGNVVGIPRQGNTPFQRLAADRKVVEASLDEAEHFIATEVGHDCVWVLVVPVEQSLFESRQAEEVVLFFHIVGGCLVNRAVSTFELFVGVIRLARHAVAALVHVELDIASVVARLQQFSYAYFVTLFGGANEVVVPHVEALPCVGIQRGNFIDELVGCLAGGVCVLLHFQPVFIGAGQ